MLEVSHKQKANLFHLKYNSFFKNLGFLTQSSPNSLQTSAEATSISNKCGPCGFQREESSAGGVVNQCGAGGTKVLSFCLDTAELATF